MSPLTMAYYNMILTEAIFQLLEEKGLQTRAQVKERMAHRWRGFEILDERGRILRLDAEPETRGITEIGPSFKVFKADQTNGYIVSPRHVSLSD